MIISINHLLLVFGKPFFSVIEKTCPNLLVSFKNSIEMLLFMENHIHLELKKIYSNLDVPTFITENKEVNMLTMLYKFSIAMRQFGLGVMNKALNHFNATATIELQKVKQDQTEVRFIIQKK
jgi:hypothetical protein